MRKILFLLFLLLDSLFAFSQWNSLESGTTNFLYAVHFTNTDVGYAIGQSGTIL